MMKALPKKKKKKLNPEEILILNDLEELLLKLGIELKYENGRFKGGLCRVDEKEFFYLNKVLPFEQKISIISKQLKSMNLDNVYLKPKIREILET